MTHRPGPPRLHDEHPRRRSPMTRKLKPVAVLCAMALLSGALPAFSQPEPGSSDPAERESLPPGPRMMDRLADKLELSEAQRGQLKEISPGTGPDPRAMASRLSIRPERSWKAWCAIRRPTSSRCSKPPG